MAPDTSLRPIESPYTILKSSSCGYSWSPYTTSYTLTPAVPLALDCDSSQFPALPPEPDPKPRVPFYRGLKRHRRR